MGSRQARVPDALRALWIRSPHIHIYNMKEERAQGGPEFVAIAYIKKPTIAQSDDVMFLEEAVCHNKVTSILASYYIEH